MTELARVASEGGVILVPTDTVYGLAAALDVPAGVAALYALKGRPPSTPCQVILLSQRLVDDAILSQPSVVASVMRRLLPGPTTVIVSDPGGRYAAAAGGESGSVGLRVPRTDLVLDQPLIATSANDPGGPDPASVTDVPEHIRAGCDLILDHGRLPGIASAVVDLRPLATGQPAVLIRPGADPDAVLRVVSQRS